MPIVPYDRQSAVAYAHRWAFARNPRYYNFDDLGGDCTNYASQALYAGCGIMNYASNDRGWFYISLNRRAPAWTGVEELHRFLINNTAGPGPFAEEVEPGAAEPGDIVQLSFDGEGFQHSPVIVRSARYSDELLVAAHTYDTDYRPLSTYPYAAVRFLHILGIRKA